MKRTGTDQHPTKWTLVLTLLALWLGSAEASAGWEERASERRMKAEQAAERGDFEQAIAENKEALVLYQRNRAGGLLIDTQLGLASAHAALGEQRLATEEASDAVKGARALGDRARLAAALSRLGSLQMFSHAATAAGPTLEEALEVARAAGEKETVAAVLNDLGNLQSAQEKFALALDSYREAASLAKAAGHGSLATKASINAARTAVLAGQFAVAADLNRAGLAAALALPDAHDKAFSLMRAGKTWELLFERAPAHDNRHRADALRAYEKGAVTATALGDDRALSYALGYSGHLYEQEKKWADALRLTRRAAFLAQKVQSPDSLYRWEWQTARIDRAQGRRDDAIADYRRAIGNIERIRTDLSARFGNPNAHTSFREAVGEIFLELADLLLQRADGLRDAAAVVQCIREAQDTCELLKSVELEDYFQDDCVHLLQSKTKTVEATVKEISKGAAVLYLVPLPDRTEIIISSATGLERVKAPVNAATLTETVRAFRTHLETRTTNEYLAEAWQLYDWLIRPLEPLLARGKIDTLVFVPDGALRTIPMAALHDGQKFLVEKYAVAVTPGLSLMEPKAIKRAKISMMASGLSEAVLRDGENFPALPFVEKEIGDLNTLYGGSKLLNGAFLTESVAEEFKAQQFSVVHIASHGEFSGDAKKTFVLTFDGKLSLDRLEQMIRPSQLRKQPVELLTLSACQTAAGDDRAALGLAGVAVKAGARAAFATLWFVSDEASTHLITDFYTALHADPELTKAQALRGAQRKLLANPRYSHPCLWAPYLIIGNWL